MFMQLNDSYTVRQLIGHKTATMTDRYIHIANALLTTKDEKWICKAVTTKEQAMKLIETGFQYVTTIEGIQLFKKRR
jgi:hypothetical protein